MFRVYELRICINGTWYNEVWIDSHYKEKHSQSIDDQLILELVGQLSFDNHLQQAVSDTGFKFYETDLYYNNKPYRLIWVIPPDESYLGVRNAYRRSR